MTSFTLNSLGESHHWNINLTFQQMTLFRLLLQAVYRIMDGIEQNIAGIRENHVMIMGELLVLQRSSIKNII